MDNSRIKIVTDKEGFNDSCMVIDLRIEYGPNKVGKEDYCFVTSLSEQELMKQYGDILKDYKPYIIINKQFKEIRRKFISNNEKFEIRETLRTDISIEGTQDVCHQSGYDLIEYYITVNQMWLAINGLPINEQERIIKRYFLGWSLEKIAEDENLTINAVKKRIQKTHDKLRNFLL